MDEDGKEREGYNDEKKIKEIKKKSCIRRKRRKKKKIIDIEIEKRNKEIFKGSEIRNGRKNESIERKEKKKERKIMEIIMIKRGL